MVRQLVGEALHVGEDVVVDGPDLERLLVDFIWGKGTGISAGGGGGGVAGVQMTAWGSLARDVPRRNLRSFCVVSGEKV